MSDSTERQGAGDYEKCRSNHFECKRPCCAIATEGSMASPLEKSYGVIGGGVVLFFVLVAIFAPLIAPFNPNKPDFMNRMQGHLESIGLAPTP